MKLKYFIAALLFVLTGCTKQIDYSYLNTNRIGCKTFVRVSARYSINWDSLTTIKGLPERCCDSAVIWNEKYRDTLIWHPETCPPPVESMPEFRIEVRYYEQVKQQ